MRGQRREYEVAFELGLEKPIGFICAEMELGRYCL
jgi:hypothetical protein